jgi:outer membrane immunogenic protein
MRKVLFIFAVIGAMAAVGPAAGADLALKAPPIAAAPVQSWTGLYIGANGGLGWSNVNVSADPFGTSALDEIIPQSFSLKAKSGVFGGQLGYNWQAGNWVLGIEGDYDAAGINGSQQSVFASKNAAAFGGTNTFAARENINSLASIRGRLGYTWGPGLFYFTGGGAWENVQTNATISANPLLGGFFVGNSATGSFSSTRSGYVVGGGLEWLVAQSWTVRAEYLYYNFTGGGNSNGLSLACDGGCGVNIASADNNISVLRLGANYKIDWFR